MSTITFENQKLIDSQRICCFNNKSLTIHHQLDKNNTLGITFNFNYDDGEVRYNVTSVENGQITFNLYNFKSHFGTGLKKPEPIAKYNGKQISIVFFVRVLPDANPILDYSLYLEG